MLMVKNRGKNRGKTGENRAETGPPGQSPQARFIAAGPNRGSAGKTGA